MHSAEIRDALLCQPLGTVFKSVAGSYLDRPHDPSNIRLFVYINRANAIAEGAMQGNLSTWSLSALKFGFRRAVAPILTFPRCDGRRDDIIYLDRLPITPLPCAPVTLSEAEGSANLHFGRFFVGLRHSSE